ncbi:MAG: acetylxylan esterase [Clostridia bacterium]|nr:acetylxylan esterase [Clostridia bacterium]
MLKINGDSCHELLLDSQKQLLAYNDQSDFFAWRENLKEKFIELIGVKEIEKNACPISVEIEEEIEFETYKRIRFTFESEKGSVVPCYLLIPKNTSEKPPLVITLQGHTTGFHNSIGVPKYEEDYVKIERNSFAVQAVERGYVALAIEQRAMGERKTNIHEPDKIRMCAFQALTAFELGRTLVGERVWDVSKAIDAMSFFSDLVDLDKIIITGNSGGGTASFYSAIYDKRIKICAPSCAFASYKMSIMKLYHCACNYIPGALKWFDMGDLTALVAPRQLTIFAGEKDIIFPLTSVKSAFDTAEKIYGKVGAKENVKLITHPYGHLWEPELIWQAIALELEKLK